MSYAPKIVTINFWVESSSDTKRSASLDNLKYSAAGFFTSVATSRVEEGDSGAPLLVSINGEWKLAGVVKGRGQSIFGNWDAMTAADSKLCSIATQTKSVELQSLLCQ